MVRVLHVLAYVADTLKYFALGNVFVCETHCKGIDNALQVGARHFVGIVNKFEDFLREGK